MPSDSLDRSSAPSDLPDPVAALMLRYLPDLRAFVRLRLGETIRAREESSDLVQSVCRELLAGSRTPPTDESTFRQWLFVAAERKIVDHARYWGAERRDGARETPVDAADDNLALAYASVITPSRAAIAREDLARVERAFDELPAEYREVILNHRLLSMSHAEIARSLGRSEGAVRNILYRGLARLTELMASS